MTGWTKLLLSWFDANKRNLPWREDKNPYRIWVSEIMLQQTRVEAVKPYFANWMNQFPTMEDVAKAPVDDVLKAWQGLGYYSRARNLQEGIREIVATYGGKLPQERRLMERVKGVGPYTAGAILSIAFNEPEVAIDGNVLRIFARLYEIEDNILSSTGRKKIESLAEDVLPKERPGDFNEALMDFGATICVPKSPKCNVCPIRSYCQAYEHETMKDLPVRIVKKSQRVVPLTVLLVEREGRYLLHRRPQKGLLSHLWEFPSGEGRQGRQEIVEALEKININVTIKSKKIFDYIHTFSHLKWHMKAYRATLRDGCKDVGDGALPPNWEWVEPDSFSQRPWAGPHGKITVLCKEERNA